MAPIGVVGRTRQTELMALVDTGAIETVLPMDLWTSGELDPEPISSDPYELVVGNGGILRVNYASVNLQFAIGRQVHVWAAIVGFSEDREEAVLGDAGFLRYFKAYFDRHQKILAIDRNLSKLPPVWIPSV